MVRFPDRFFEGSAPIVLLAGGAGFIGSHLSERLLAKNAKVICIDNWQTGVKENVKHLEERTDFFLLERDVGKPLPKNLERVDYVVHLAGVEAYLNGEDVSLETLEANSIGTKNLLNLAKEKKSRFLLASTVNVYSANLSATSTDSYFGPGRTFEGEFSQHEAKRFAEALTSEYGQKFGVDVRIVRLADTYGPRMMLASSQPIANLIKQALYGETLKIPGGEDLALYPIYVDDVVEGIAKSLFSSGTKGKIISVVGSRTSAFTFAQSLQRVAGAGRKDLKIEFTNKEFPQREISEEVLYAGRAIISWEPKTSLDEGLERTVRWFTENKSRVPGERAAEVPSKKGKPARSFWDEVIKARPRKVVAGFRGKLGLAIGALLIVWFFLFPFVQVGASLGQLALAKRDLLSDKPESASRWSAGAQSWAQSAAQGFMRWEAIPGLKNEARTLSSKSKVLARAAGAAKTASGAARELAVLVSGILGEGSFDPQLPAGNLARELEALDQQLAFLEAEIKEEELVINFPLLPEFELTRTFDFAKARRVIAGASGILPEAGELLGKGGKKTYLLLLQNNMELRPTGGFIGSFGLLTFERGRFINLEVFDVYTADGQLKGHVEPPEPIKEHLGEASWFLRDSNWSPDFAKSAQRAVWFIDKEMGQKVDGVVGIDLDFARELVKTYGPVNLPDFNEEVTADNFYEKTQYAVEGDFFPGSRAKKDFLTALIKQLLGEVFAKDKDSLSLNKFVPLAKTAFSALERRHMAIWLDNENAMSALKKNGWDGGLKTARCRTESCAADYLMVVEANLGVNKANYFLDRNYSLETTVKDDALAHKLTITYKNRSEGNSWPGGDYKNYVRIFAKREALSFKGVVVDPASGKEKALEIDEQEEEGKKSFGMLAPVPAGQTRQLIFSWEVPFKNSQFEELVFLWQKQMGLSEDPLWLLVQLPEGGRLTQALPTPSLTAQSGVGYNTEFTQDLLFNLQWQTQR